MVLIINTADDKTIFIAFIDKQGEIIAQKQFAAQYHQADKLLGIIKNLSQSIKKPPPKIKGLIVVAGPGPFTALRIGITVANAFAWALNIPIVGLKQTEFTTAKELITKGLSQLKKTKTFRIIEPYYDKRPNITIKKK